jgi:hypothetical protein
VSSAIRKVDSGVYVLDPAYQRNSVWTPAQKRLLIDSILNGIPIPSLYLNELSSSHFDVVDGQQRLRTLSEYRRDEFELADDSIWPKKKFSQLPERCKDVFEEYQLTFTVLTEWDSEQIEDMFLRLQNGTTLLAPEKRRAIQGTFRDVVRDLASHNIFEYVNFNNRRYGFEDSVAKALHLRLSNSWRRDDSWKKVSPSLIAKTYKMHSNITSDAAEVKSLKKAYTYLYKGFRNNEVNPKLKKWLSFSLPLVFCDLNEKYDMRNLEREFAAAFFRLQEKRVTEDERGEDSDPRFLMLKDAARADDPVNMNFRHNFMYDWFLAEVDLQPKNLDQQRLFNEEQRVVIFRRSGGKCAICSCAIDQENFDADHIVRHVDQGLTVVSNGRALCQSCNRGRGE